MKQASLANITYEHALGLIQLRKEALDTGSAPALSPATLAASLPMRDAGDAMLRRLSEKRAAGFMDAIKGAWKDPAVKSTVIGGGLGALGGLGKTMVDEEDDNYVQNMLMGGAGGAALGGAAGLAFNPGSLDKATDFVGKQLETTPKTPNELALEEAQDIQASGSPAQDRLDLEDAANSNTHHYIAGAQALGAPLAVSAGGRFLGSEKLPFKNLDPAVAFSSSPGTANFNEFAKVEGIKNMPKLTAAQSRAANIGLQNAGVATLGKAKSYAPNVRKAYHALNGGMTQNDLRRVLEAHGIKPSWLQNNLSAEQLGKLKKLMSVDASKVKNPTGAFKPSGFWSNVFKNRSSGALPPGVAPRVGRAFSNARYMPKGKAAMMAIAMAFAAKLAVPAGVKQWSDADSVKTQKRQVRTALQLLDNPPQGNP